MKLVYSKKILREFGIIVGLILPIIFGFLLPLIFNHDFRIWTLFVGSTLLITGIIKPNLLYFPYLIWMKIGLILGWINSRIIFSLIFIFVLNPIAIILKIIRYDPLNKKQTFQNSYKEIRDFKNIDLKRIF